MATSKPSLRVKIDVDLSDQIDAFSRQERKVLGEAINAVVEAWGKPHLHAGIGIRRLTRKLYECRIGRNDRLAFLFIATPPELLFLQVGDHDEIQRLVKTLR